MNVYDLELVYLVFSVANDTGFPLEQVVEFVVKTEGLSTEESEKLYNSTFVTSEVPLQYYGPLNNVQFTNWWGVAKALLVSSDKRLVESSLLAKYALSPQEASFLVSVQKTKNLVLDEMAYQVRSIVSSRIEKLIVAAKNQLALIRRQEVEEKISNILEALEESGYDEINLELMNWLYAMERLGKEKIKISVV